VQNPPYPYERVNPPEVGEEKGVRSAGGVPTFFNLSMGLKPYTVEVIELDQWTATGQFTHVPFAELKLEYIQGIPQLWGAPLGGHLERREVEPDDKPPLGHVWLIQGSDLMPRVWRTNYDAD
jgi:hypothetical protein